MKLARIPIGGPTFFPRLIPSMRLVLSAGLLNAVLIIPVVAAQEVLAHDDGTISINASGERLGQVLRAIAEVRPFEKLAIDPDVEERAVTVTLEHEPVARVLLVILRSVDVDYVMVGLGRRLGVGDREFVASARLALGDDVPSSETVDAPGAQPEIAGQSFVEEPRMAEGMAVDEPIEAPDPIANALKKFELEQMLAPSVPPARSDWIELPFPGPDGLPQIVRRPAAGSVVPQVPFPVAPSVAVPAVPVTSTPGAISAPAGSAQPGMLPAAPPQPVLQPIVVDPKLQKLIQDLTAPVAPQGR